MEKNDGNGLASSLQILFVDDELSILKSLRRVTMEIEAECFFASSGAEGMSIIKDNNIDVVVSDMMMPKMSGAEFLGEVAAHYPETIRIALSGATDQQTVLDAVNQGHIWGYLNKPWDNEHLLVTLDQAIFLRRLILERLMLLRTVKRLEQFNRGHLADFIGDSTAMQPVYHIIEKAAPSSASVFITGSSGTGKEVAATAIHRLSKRSEQPLITLNCAAIPSELLESEVFGHIKGAFSGAINNRDGAATLADGGTLFLDELAEMDIALQSKLLRFIQTSSFQRVGSSKTETVDIRFVCATNKNPQQAIDDGLLREDLFYRLNVISLELPDLKEREWDALLLANHFLQVFAKTEDKLFIGFDEATEQLIHDYPWPGNVRQLENAINSAVIMSDGPLLTVADMNISLKISDSDLKNLQCSEPLRQKTISQSQTGAAAEGSLLPVKSLSEVEKEAIVNAMLHCGDNVSKAASLLDVSPSTLYRKMQQWELEKA